MTDTPQADPGTALLSLRLARTPLGQQEITVKQMTLARPARNLLLIIDAKRSAGDWLALVRGAGAQDLQQLLAAGLVATAAAPSPASVAPPVHTPPPVPPMTEAPAAPAVGIPVATARMSLGDALQAQSYKLLYDRMTAEARPQLGLIKGYKLILDIERCSGPDEIRLLAVQFVERVRAVHGDVKARALAQRLADPP